MRKMSGSEPDESDGIEDTIRVFSKDDKNYALKGPDDSVTELNVSHKSPLQFSHQKHLAQNEQPQPGLIALDDFTARDVTPRDLTKD